jgi:hypothetical protein
MAEPAFLPVPDAFVQLELPALTLDGQLVLVSHVDFEILELHSGQFRLAVDFFVVCPDVHRRIGICEGSAVFRSEALANQLHLFLKLPQWAPRKGLPAGYQHQWRVRHHDEILRYSFTRRSYLVHGLG